jgi:hypothetical protein
MWYVWQCNKCAGTLTINYDATEADYLRFKNCGCKEKGEFVWSHNTDDSGKVYKP